MKRTKGRATIYAELTTVEGTRVVIRQAQATGGRREGVTP